MQVTILKEGFTMVQPILAGLRNLLVCTDGSEYSEGAIREGIRLAKQSDAAMTALSVVDFNPEFDALAPDLVEKMEKEIGEHLRAVKERAEKEGVRCRTFMLRSETPYIAIAREAENLRAGIIVVGRRGRTGLKRLMMGSVAKRVIGHAPCSVLVVPRGARLEFRKVLCATDGSAYSEAAVAEAVQIVKRSGAELSFASVVRAETASPLDIVQSQMQRGLIVLAVAESSIRKAKEIAGKEGLQAEGGILAGRPFEAIVTSAREKGADLIVMGSHGRTGVDRLLMGSVTERVIGIAECAVLVVKVPK
jgi:nucleotide-binding universal stress UspA family protein